MYVLFASIKIYLTEVPIAVGAVKVNVSTSALFAPYFTPENWMLLVCPEGVVCVPAPCMWFQCPKPFTYNIAKDSVYRVGTPTVVEWSLIN